MKKVYLYSLVSTLILSSCGAGKSSQEVTTLPQNNSPRINSSATFNADENQTSIGTVIATDPDGDSVNYSITGTEINISSSGVLTFIAAPDYETQNLYLATVSVSDGSLSTSQNITVNVNDVNENNELSLIHYGNTDSSDRLLGIGRYENGSWVEHITFKTSSTHDGAGVGQPSIILNNFIFPNRSLELGFSSNGVSMLTKGEIIEFFIGDSSTGADYGALSIRSVDGVFGGEIQARNALDTGSISLKNTNDEYLIQAREFDDGNNVSTMIGVE